MTRDQVKAIFPDATDEQITNYLNQHNSEIANVRTEAEKKASKYKDDAEKAKDLQRQLDEINDKNLSDIEKSEKALAEANEKIAKLEKAQRIADLKAELTSELKINAEQIEKLVDEDGNINHKVLGQIMSEKESAAAQAKEAEIANGSTNPSGGSGGNSGGDDKTEAEQYAINLGKEQAESIKTAKSVLDNYL